jgi:hypothetical protein
MSLFTRYAAEDNAAPERFLASALVFKRDRRALRIFIACRDCSPGFTPIRVDRRTAKRGGSL